jgi:hypothetical protein
VWKETIVAHTGFLKGLRNTTETSVKLNQCMGRDSNRDLSEYNSEAWLLQFTCSANSPYWETDSRWASKEIPQLLWELKFNCRVITFPVRRVCKLWQPCAHTATNSILQVLNDSACLYSLLIIVFGKEKLRVKQISPFPHVSIALNRRILSFPFPETGSGSPAVTINTTTTTTTTTTISSCFKRALPVHRLTLA